VGRVFSPQGADAHATAVAGIAAATGNNDDGIAGINWNADIWCRRTGDSGDIIERTQELIDAGVEVINHSWGQNLVGGEEFYSVFIAWSFALAYKNNIVSVIAMPEDGVPSIFPSAYHGFNLNVAATNREGLRASYSHPHPFVDVGAPGGDGSGGTADIRVLTLDPQVNRDWFGTSFAAPHVAGIASLLKAYNQAIYARLAMNSGIQRSYSPIIPIHSIQPQIFAIDLIPDSMWTFASTMSTVNWSRSCTLVLSPQVSMPSCGMGGHEMAPSSRPASTS
jgi:subtilisin family serine protease